MEIEHRIKSIIKSKKLTIKALAEQSGVSETGLGKNLMGKSSMTLCTLYKVSKALGVSWTDYEKE